MSWKRSEIDRFCTCRWLEQAALEPNVPVEFEDHTNEYHLVYGEGDQRARLTLFFCPMCGCKAPESRRGEMFAVMPTGELDRLHDLTRGIKTIEDALRILGTPDEDLDIGGAMIVPGTDETPPRAFFHERTLHYRKLSDTVDVTVQGGGPEPAQVFFSGRLLRETSGDESG